MLKLHWVKSQSNSFQDTNQRTRIGCDDHENPPQYFF